ncbi:MAG: hypothetical protein QOJ98_3201 [Acidobacteriota bacterium]|nr:hypothetical protein [Acidobacteriota bacterium]
MRLGSPFRVHRTRPAVCRRRGNWVPRLASSPWCPEIRHSEGRRQSVMPLTLGSEPRCVGSDDMGRYRSTQGRCLRNPKNCPTRALRSLQHTASRVPILGRRVPRAREWGSHAGLWVRNPFACAPNAIARGRKPPAWVAKAFPCLREHGVIQRRHFAVLGTHDVRSATLPMSRMGLDTTVYSDSASRWIVCSTRRAPPGKPIHY